MVAAAFRQDLADDGPHRRFLSQDQRFGRGYRVGKLTFGGLAAALEARFLTIARDRESSGARVASFSAITLANRPSSPAVRSVISIGS